MDKNSCCLYHNDFASFLSRDIDSIFGTLCNNHHDDALITTRETWRDEFAIVRTVLFALKDENGQIIFEYLKSIGIEEI